MACVACFVAWIFFGVVGVTLQTALEVSKAVLRLYADAALALRLLFEVGQEESEFIHPMMHHNWCNRIKHDGNGLYTTFVIVISL